MANSHPDERSYEIASVARALDILETLARIGPAPLCELAKAAGSTPSAAFRLLRTLEGKGFAIQDSARGAWRLGARFGVLGRAAGDQGALAATAMPVMTALGGETGEGVYLLVRDGLESVTATLYLPRPELRRFGEIGARRPLHAGLPRLLLAYAPESIARQFLTQRLPRFTPQTRTDPAAISADLPRIRARGWLLTADETEEGTTGVAAPVRDGRGEVVAALGIAAPTLRLRAHRARALAPVVIAAAERISALLGAPLSREAPPKG